MNQKPTNIQIASDEALWNKYYSASSPFGALTFEQRLEVINQAEAEWRTNRLFNHFD